MSSPVHCVRPDDALAHARKEMTRRSIAQLPVVDDRGALVGIVAIPDIIWRGSPKEGRAERGGGPAPHGLEAAEGPVRAAMTAPEATLRPGMTAEEAASELAERGLGAAPVVDQGRVVGIVSSIDLLKALAPRVRGSLQVAAAMRPRLPRVARHTSLAGVLRVMRDEATREVAVTEGQAAVPELAPPADGDAREPVHRGRTAETWGIVGLISLQDFAAGAWFDRHEAHGRRKRIAEARRVEGGGSKRLRHVEEVEAVAEDIMQTRVAALVPGDDVTTAVRLFEETGASGLPVLGAGPAPGFLDREELLAAVVARMKANRAAREARSAA